MNRKLTIHFNKNAGFTLLELIIVIIIIGILATAGLSQYTITVEKGRLGEAFANMSKIRKEIVSYYLQNGTLATIVESDVGIGIDPTLPIYTSSCVSTNYFRYRLYGQTATSVQIYCYRCTSGGKLPQMSYQYAPFETVSSSGSVTSRNCYEWATGTSPTWCIPP